MLIELKRKVELFERLYGYKVSGELFNWIFLSELSAGKRAFVILERNKDNGLRIIPQFIIRLDEESILQPTDVSFTLSTAPYVQVGESLGGHYFFAPTIFQKPGCIYYLDSEGSSLFHKNSTTATKLIKEQLSPEEKTQLKDVKKELSAFISKDSKDIDAKYLAPKLERPNTWSGDIMKNVEQGRFGNDLFNLRKVLVKNKNTTLGVKIFISHQELLENLDQNDSDYHTIDTARGRINCAVIRTSLIYYFANELELLNELLVSANNGIKGTLFKAFVSNFKISLEEKKDFSFLGYKENVKMRIE